MLFAFILVSLFVTNKTYAVGQGNPQRIIFVHSGDAGSIASATALKQKIPSADVISSNDINRKRWSPCTCVFVAVDESSLQVVTEVDLPGVVISLFVPYFTYKDIVDGTGNERRWKISAIFPEPSISSQMHVLSMLYKGRIKGSVLISTGKMKGLDSFLASNTDSTSRVDVEEVISQANIGRVISSIGLNTAILAVPDKEVINNSTLKNFLLSAYRHGTPVVGFSYGMVKAGAIAAPVSGIGDITAQLEEVLKEYFITGKLQVAQYPKYYSIVVNEHVAKSYDLVVDEDVRTYTKSAPGAH